VALLRGQNGPIGVYGATGYTGRLIAAELALGGAELILSGRNPAKLEALAAELGGAARTRVATLDDPESLRQLLEPCAVVIDCAGPFLLYGEPVLRAAVETRTHYLDTSGEQAYIRIAFDRYGQAAESAGVAVVPAMGFDFAPGDMLASLTAEGMGEVDELSLSYGQLNFSFGGIGATRGTMLTSLLVARGGDVEWQKLQWLPASGGRGAGSFDFGGELGRQRMLRYPAGEQITVPRHVATRRVRTSIAAATLAPHPRLAFAVPLLMPSTSLMLRTPLRKLLERAVERLPEGPSAEQRQSARFAIVCQVRRGRRVRRGTLRGRDVYGLTAALLARAGRETARRGFAGVGALAPSQAFDPRSFLDGFERFELDLELEAPREAPEPIPA
jgi:short subunit dehydrogenase-like uncharacterized protein